METKMKCNVLTKLSVGEIAKLSFGIPSVIIICNQDVSNNFDNYDHVPMDAAGSQMPAEKTAAELNSFSLQIIDTFDNKTSPDWNLSDDLYDDLTEFYAESSGASSCGSFDDYLEIVNDIELGELDDYLARATVHESIHA
jgi:hypothetical protein